MKVFQLLFFSFLILSSLQCNTVKIPFSSAPEFDILEVYAEDFVGGLPGNSGTNVVINVVNNKEIIPDSLYFQNRVAVIEVRKLEEKTLWVARFQKVARKDININENPTGAINVHIPENNYFPFELTNREAVLLFKENGTPLYFKIENIAQRETIYFASPRPNNQ